MEKMTREVEGLALAPFFITVAMNGLIKEEFNHLPEP